MAFTATATPNPINIQLGVPATLVSLTPSIKYNCPYSAYTVGNIKLDYRFLTVNNQTSLLATSSIASYSAPSLSTVPYSYNYLLLFVTDYWYVG